MAKISKKKALENLNEYEYLNGFNANKLSNEGEREDSEYSAALESLNVYEKSTGFDSSKLSTYDGSKATKKAYEGAVEIAKSKKKTGAERYGLFSGENEELNKGILHKASKFLSSKLNDDSKEISEEDSRNHASEVLASVSDDNKELLKKYVDAQDADTVSPFAFLNNMDSPVLQKQQAKNSATMETVKKQFMENTGVDEKTFNKMLANYTYSYHAEQNDKQKEELQNSSKATKALASGLDVVASPVTGLLSLAGTGKNKVDTELGRDNHTVYASLKDFSENTEEAVLNDAEKIDNKALRTAAKGAYEVGMATGKSAMSMMTGSEAASALGLTGKSARAVANLVSLPQFGASAYTSTLEDAQERGLDTGSAYKTALVAGAAEMATEVISLEGIWDILEKQGKVGVKTAIGNVLKQGYFEGSEEVMNDLVNEIADGIINGDKSQYNQSVKYYMSDQYAEDNGLDVPLSEEAAKKKARIDFAKQVGQDFLLGGLSGGLMGAGATAVNSYANTKGGKYLSGNEQIRDDIVLNKDSDNYISDDRADYDSEEDYQKAQSVIEQLIDDSGEAISNKEARSLYKNVSEAIGSQNSNRADAQIQRDVEAIESAQTPEELVRATESVSNKTEEVQQAIDNAKARMVAQGATQADFDNVITPARAYQMAKSGQVSESDLESMSDDIKRAAVTGYSESVSQDIKNVTKFDASTVLVKENGKAKQTNITGEVIKSGDQYYLTTKKGAKVELSEDILSGQTKANGDNTKGKLLMYGNSHAEGIISLEDPELMTIALQTKINQPSVPSTSIVKAVRTFNTLGRSGVSFDSAVSDKKQKFMVDAIGETVLRKAYDLGAKEGALDEEKMANPTTKKGSGKVSFASSEAETKYNDLSSASRTFIDKFAQKTGVNFEIFSDDADTEGTVRGQYVPEEGKIRLNVADDTDILEVAMHEGIGEFLKAHNAEGYAEITETVLNYYAENNADALAKRIEDYKRAYSDEKGKSTRGSADELVNDVLAEIFSDENGIEKLGNWLFENDMKKEAKTIKDVLIDFVNQMKSWIADIKAQGGFSAAERSKLSMTDKDMDALQDRILKAMDEAIQNRDSRAEGETAEQRIRNSVKVAQQNFEKQLNMWDGKNPRVKFNLGMINGAIKNYTSRRGNIYLDGSKLINIKNKHSEMTNTMLKGLPQMLAEPVLIMESKQSDTRIVLAGELMDENNKPVIAVLELEPRGKGITLDDIKLASAYRKDNLQNLINTSKVLFTDSKKIRSWSKRTGLQLPVGLKSTSTDSISQTAQNATRNSVKVDANGTQYVEIDEDIVKGITGSKNIKSAVRAYIKDNYPSIDMMGFKLGVNAQSRNEFVNSKTSQYMQNKLKRFFIDKMRMAGNLEEIVNVGDGYTWEDIKHSRKDKLIGFVRGNVQIRVGNNDYIADIVLADDKTKGLIFYDIVNMKSTAIKEAPTERTHENHAAQVAGASTDSISQNAQNATEIINKVAEKGRKSVRVDEPVSANDELVAIHNTTPQQLIDTIKLGGFPSPSIAIVKAAMGHEKYGTVSVVFGRDSIDPEVSKKNRIYGGDAWTAVFPKVEYKINEDVIYRLSQYLDDNLPSSIRALGGYDCLDIHNAETMLGKGGLIDSHYANDPKFGYLFITKENGLGRKLEIPMKEADSKSGLSTSELEAVIAEVGSDKLSDIQNDRNKYFAFSEELPDILNEIHYKEYVKAHPETDIDSLPAFKQKVIKRHYNPEFWNLGKTDRVIEDVETLTKGNGFESTVDEYTLRDEIQRIVESNKDAYEKWIENLFDGVFEKQGLRNNKDLYDNMGNERSWEALHEKITLDNIVKLMNEEDDQGATGMFSQSVIQALATKKFKSIDDMKSSMNQLQMMTDEEYSAEKEKYFNEFSAIVNAIQNKDADNQFIAYQQASDAIADAVRVGTDEKTIMRELRRYGSLDLQADTAKRISNLMSDLSDMVTGYFEAKPKRAVYLDEILKVVCPSTEGDLVEVLEQNNIPYETYEEGNEEARKGAVNSTENARFSKKVKGQAELKQTITSVMNGNYDERYVSFGTTPAIYSTVLGIKRLPMEMTTNHVYSVAVSEAKAKRDGKYSRKQNYHNLGADILSQLPKAMRNPAIIMKSTNATSDARFVAVTMMNDRAGNPIMAAVEVNAEVKNNQGKWLDVNLVLSSYGKDNLSSYVNKAYKDNRILYVNKTNSQQIMGVPSVQFRGGVISADYTNNLRAYRQIVNENQENKPRTSRKVDDARKSIKEYGIVSPYHDTLNEANVVSAIMGKMNEALDGVSVDLNGVMDVTKSIIKKYDANISTNDLAGAIWQTFNYMNDNQMETDYQGMMDYLLNIGDEVIATSHLKDAYQQEVYDEVRKNLRSHAIKLTDADRDELKNRFGSWKDAFGEIQKTGIKLDNSGMNVDSVYNDIREEVMNLSGVQMPEETTAADQIISIIDTVAVLEPSMSTFEGANDLDKSLMVASDIIDEYYTRAVKEMSNNIVEGTDAGKKAVKEAVDKQTEKLRKEMQQYKKTIRASYQDQVTRYKTELERTQKDLRAVQNNLKNWKPVPETQILNQAELDAKAEQMATKALTDYKMAQERSKQIDNIKRTGHRMIRWLDAPTDKQHVPEFLQRPLSEFLSSVDFLPLRAKETSKNTLDWKHQMMVLKDVIARLKESDPEIDSDGYALSQVLVVDELVEKMQNILDNNQDVNMKVSKLPAGDLKEMSEVLSSLSAAINHMNTTYANSRYTGIGDLARASIREMQERKQTKTERTKAGNAAFNFFNLDEIEPLTFFEGLGSASASIYEELRHGFDIRTNHIRETADFFEKKKKELGISDKEMAEWGKEKHEFHFPGGDITMTTPQIMSLLETVNRKQGKPHVEAGGIKIADTEVKVGKVKKIVHMTKAVHIDEAQYDTIISKLTPEQKAMANELQKYMATECADWGNRVSREMYGYKKFTEKDYFPLRTDSTTRETKPSDDQAPSYYTIKNRSFTKQITPHAANAVVIDDIFDVFTRHVVQMAEYDGYTMPIADAMRWYNYQEKEINTIRNQDLLGEIAGDTTNARNEIKNSVKQNMDRVLGKNAGAYFQQFIKDINGDYAGTGGTPDLSTYLMSSFKAQAVGANIRVIVQQPTAIIRATDRIEAKYLLQAQTSLPKAVEYAKKSQDKSAISYWKAQGYYETLIGKSLKQIITGEGTVKERITDAMGKGAGIADDLTWGIMYRAAELKVMDQHSDLKYDSEEFSKRTVEIFEDIIDHTQVVDTIFHKSQWMRNQGLGYRATSAFMAEPTKTYNMFYRAYQDCLRSGNKKEMVDRAGKTAMIFLVEQALNAAVTGFIDAWRDDDKDEGIIGFLQSEADHTKENFFGNLYVWNLFPVIKEVQNFIDGYDATEYTTEGLATAVDTISELYKVVTGQSNKTFYGVSYLIAQGISQLSGVPLSSALREVKSLYNTLNGIWGGTDWYKSMTTQQSAEKRKRQTALNNAIQKKDLGDSKDAMNKIFQEAYDNGIENGKSKNEAESDAWSSVRSALKKSYQEQEDRSTATINRYVTLLQKTKKKVSGKNEFKTVTEKDARDTVKGW